MDFRKALAVTRVEEIAPRVLGAILTTPVGSCQIVEVEAYGGSDDPGSHAFRRQTPKNATMFGPPGHAYVYFTYGNHWMLNLVAHADQDPAAILIRAAKPLTGQDQMYKNRPKATKETDLLSGPGKLCAALEINKLLDGHDILTPNKELSLQITPQRRPYLVSTRIGLAEGKGEHTPWRFVDAEEVKWASRPHPKGNPIT